MLLKGKNVIVSGIGPGLGIELALRSAEQGAAGIALAARTESKLDDAEKAIAKLKLSSQPKVIKVATDISDRAACDHLVAESKKAFGSVDCLYNSAYHPGKFVPIEDSDLNDWHDVFAVNLFGTMHLTQATIPLMKAQKGGSIVMINTMVTRKPLKTHASYAASKAALSSATSHLALELGGYGIRVNAAFMGWMWGPSVEGFMKDIESKGGPSVAEQRKHIATSIALGDIPKDDDCAKAAVFLASDYSCAITGACLDVNGGEFLPH
jgi:NAD(P)-dependent dehydrogenase (short-subunit alcohol dehydrogenase family)